MAGVMRISLLSTMKGYYGGEVHLAHLAAGLLNRGHEVTCLVHTGGLLQEKLRANGVPTMGVDITQWFQARPLARLRNHLQGSGAQILHSHNPRDYFIAAAAGWGLGVANIGTRHHLRPMAQPRLKRPFLSKFRRLIAVSEAVQMKLLEDGLFPEDKIVCIPNGTPLVPTQHTGRPSVGRLRLACGATMDDPVIGVVGRLGPEKGLETVIRAMARMVAHWPRLKLCLVGDEAGQQVHRQELEALVRGYGLEGTVYFVGYQPDAQHVARQFNALVVSSRAEPFGLVTIEAMAQGCPVVVTNTGGSPEIVRDGVEGFLFSPGDDQQLAKRLEILLESPGLNRQMGTAGRLRVQESFNLDLMVMRTEEVYRQALCAPKNLLGNLDLPENEAEDITA